MPVKRRASKVRHHRITQDAIDAFLAGDYCALHRALGLKPWEASPLPLEVTPLGVDQSPSDGPEHLLFHESWPKAQELQRELLEATGGRLPKAETNHEPC